MPYRPLIETSDPGEIALIKSLLDAEGIVYVAEGEAFSAIRLPPEPVRFLVAEDRWEEAQALVARLSRADD